MSGDERSLSPRQLVRALAQFDESHDSPLGNPASAPHTPILHDPESYGIALHTHTMADGTSSTSKGSSARLPPLPDFKIAQGKTHDLKTLLDRVEWTHFAQMRLTPDDDKTKISYVLGKCDDILFRKFMVLTEDERPSTWAAFKQWLLRQCEHPGYLLHQTLVLKHMTQGRMPLTQYVARFQAAAQTIPPEHLADLTAVAFFLDSLSNEELKKELLLITPPMLTLQEAVDTTLSMSLSLERSRQFRPQRPPKPPGAGERAGLHNTNARTMIPPDRNTRDRYGRLPDTKNDKWCAKCDCWRMHSTDACKSKKKSLN
jgi:hypothetical protein